MTTLQTRNEMAGAGFDASLMSDRWQSPEADRILNNSPKDESGNDGKGLPEYDA